MDMLSLGNGRDPTNSSSVMLEIKQISDVRALTSKMNQMWITWSQFCEFHYFESSTFSFNKSLNASIVRNWPPSTLLGSSFVEPHVPNGYGFNIKISTYDPEGK